jgi:hypothetical protein
MSSHDTNAPVVFRPRSAAWLTGVVWLVVLFSVLSAAVTHEFPALVQLVPLVALGYLAWWLAWYPAVVVSNDGVALRNPLLTVQVPWNALIMVDTKYALTLVTPEGKFAAWAAPAPGIFGVQRAQPGHVRGLPEVTYGPGESVRPGDLSNSDSGAAAFHVRSRWAELIDSGAVATGEADTATVTKRPNWPVLGAAAALVAASMLSLTG